MTRVKVTLGIQVECMTACQAVSLQRVRLPHLVPWGSFLRHLHTAAQSGPGTFTHVLPPSQPETFPLISETKSYTTVKAGLELT